MNYIRHPWYLGFVACAVLLLAVVVIVIGLNQSNESSQQCGDLDYLVETCAWQKLDRGMELTYVTFSPASDYGDSRIAVIRVDPDYWSLHLSLAPSEDRHERKTAKEWSQDEGYALVINAGMYHRNNRHDGFLQYRNRIVNSETNHYQSILAIHPRKADVSRFSLIDLDHPSVTIETLREQYESLLQNLRLVRHPGENRWSQQSRRWSEAALGEDKKGRMLFIFARSPLSMFDFNRILLKSNIGLIAAQHLEGGPPAQLYVHVNGEEHEWFGSYETGVKEDDDMDTPWGIPNVLGLRRRDAE